MAVVPGNDNLIVRTVVMIGCAGINDTLIVPGDDAFVFAPPTHPAATTTVMMVVVVVRRADIMTYTTDVRK